VLKHILAQLLLENQHNPLRQSVGLRVVAGSDAVIDVMLLQQRLELTLKFCPIVSAHLCGCTETGQHTLIERRSNVMGVLAGDGDQLYPLGSGLHHHHHIDLAIDGLLEVASQVDVPPVK